MARCSFECGRSNVVLNKKWSILLFLPLLLSVFLGGFHHSCEYYSQQGSFCTQANHQPILFLTQTVIADNLLPLPARLFFPVSEELFPDPILSFTPLNGRAPPHLS